MRRMRLCFSNRGEFRHIAALGDGNVNKMFGSGNFVILMQTRPQLGGLDPDGGVDPRIVASRLTVDGRTDGVFLYLSATSGQGFGDDERQKLTQAGSILESGSGEDPRQLRSHRLR